MGVVGVARRAQAAKDVPEKTAKQLAALKKEVTQLRAENARLQEALAQYIEQWETLDGPQVSALQFLAANAEGHASQIARAASINIQIAETSLAFLRQYDYVHPSGARRGAAGRQAKFLLSPKGARYLRERGLHK